MSFKCEKTLHVATWRAIQDLRARQQVLSWEWGTAHMESPSMDDHGAES